MGMAIAVGGTAQTRHRPTLNERLAGRAGAALLDLNEGIEGYPSMHKLCREIETLIDGSEFFAPQVLATTELMGLDLSNLSEEEHILAIKYQLRTVNGNLRRVMDGTPHCEPAITREMDLAGAKAALAAMVKAGFGKF